MKKSDKKSILSELIKGVFALLAVIFGGYFTLAAANVVDFPWAKSKIETQLRDSMSKLKTGLDELDTAIEVCSSDETCYVYCRQEHPQNVLHGYGVILDSDIYAMTGEPKYIKDAYADYQRAIQTANSLEMQKLYSACLVFDRTDAGDPDITQEEFDVISANAQEDVTNALEILNKAIQRMP